MQMNIMNWAVCGSNRMTLPWAVQLNQFKPYIHNCSLQSWRNRVCVCGEVIDSRKFNYLFVNSFVILLIPREPLPTYFSNSNEGYELSDMRFEHGIAMSFITHQFKPYTNIPNWPLQSWRNRVCVCGEVIDSGKFNYLFVNSFVI